MTNPDTDIFDGGSGQSTDRQLYIANEQAMLSTGISATDTTLLVNAPAFGNGDILAIGSERIQIISGGGASVLTVQRNMYASGASAHASGVKVYSACAYTNLTVSPIDTSSSDESSWITLALTQGGLDTREHGAPLVFATKGHDETISLWRRITVPPGTPVQNKVDIRLRLTGIESLI